MANEEWLKLHTDILDRPVIMSLPDRLAWRWVQILLCVKRLKSEEGLIDIARVAHMMHKPAGQILATVRTLAEKGLIDTVTRESFAGGIQYRVHGWSNWQAGPMSSKLRMRALRARKKEGALRHVTKGDVTVTSRDAETRLEEKDTGTTVVANSLSESVPQTMSVSPKKAQPTVSLRLLPPSEQPELRLVAPPVAEQEAEPGGRYPEAFEDLWAEYRNYGNQNSSKADAFKRWAKLSAAEKRLAFDGLTGGYLVWLISERKRKPDYPAQHLSTFLSRRGWEPFLEKRTG